MTGRANARLWGNLPAVGSFAVVSPDGQGRKLQRYSWGAMGQIEDLARMPTIVRRALPWLKIDMSRVYAFGGSMGGQETLLLAARHPELLAGAAAFDSVVDFTRQYHALSRLRCSAACVRAWDGQVGQVLQRYVREEVGGSPGTARYAFRLRSPITYARRLATSCVPLELWWSNSDRVVVNQAAQSRRLYRAILARQPRRRRARVQRSLDPHEGDARRLAAPARARDVRTASGALLVAADGAPRRGAGGRRADVHAHGLTPGPGYTRRRNGRDRLHESVQERDAHRA